VTDTLWIDYDYLANLQKTLQLMLDDVNNHINGSGNVATWWGTTWVPAVDGSLNITMPGGSPGTGSTFPLGQNLNAKLASMGGSVSEEMGFLQTVLEDMIDEIETTMDSMTSTENLNDDSVQALLSEFEQTISAMNAGPSSSGSSGSSGGPSGSGG
jgi:hypothetical protein